MAEMNQTVDLGVTIETLPPLFDEKVLAQALGVSLPWCRLARMQGRGPQFKKIGGVVRYTRRDVLEWIENQTCQNTAEGKGL